jgi:hypothetical protein
LTLPDKAGRVYKILNNGWYYDLEKEGQCQAYKLAAGETVFKKNKHSEAWPHWDESQKALAVCEHRNRIEEKDGSLKGGLRPLCLRRC